MFSEQDQQTSRVPSLVHYCQRVAVIHVDAIASLGDIRYDLVEPILKSCSADNLFRLENASRHLRNDTPELWKDLCFRDYPLYAKPYLLGEVDEPESWRDQFFVFRETQERKTEEIGLRIRKQRLEADGKKKEREVKLTDRLPPPKRSRSGWPTSSQPKTLFQKTRSEASKIQKSMYNARMIPPMASGKKFRVLPPGPSAKPPAPSSSLPGSHVIVNTVQYRRPSTSTQASAIYPSISDPASSPPPNVSMLCDPASSNRPSTNSTAAVQQDVSPDSLDLPRLPPKTASPAKKDPMAALFMPKHRAHSQLPNRSAAMRKTASRQ